MSRFVVGIDLGTTNSALAFAETGADSGPPTILPIPQVVAAGEVAERSSLPSFLLLPSDDEVAAKAMALPWAPAMRYAVGTFARERGAELPARLVASAKSWLCHSGVDRTAPLLPWRGTDKALTDDGTKVSPVNASARTLSHLRAAWDDAHPDDPLEEQEVLLTVPASFDAIARELTVVAAREAGLPQLTLLEEPQAAFYAYLASRGDGWRKELRPGDTVLVCDIGGGTTDFSLIDVRDDGGNLALERVAVGDHILLGGDNMDLTLAAVLGQRLAEQGKQLDGLQQRALVFACRRAKEQLLGEAAPVSVPVALLGRGSKLIGSTVRVDVSREDAETLLLEGFFPKVEGSARSERRRSAGLREVGLPYAHDAAITRHLAEFLAKHGRQPTALLCNGGVLQSPRLRQRLIETISSWSAAPVRELPPADLDLAVALGAAHYGRVRHGKGVRIRGGTARAYYIGIESAAPAIPGFAPPLKAMCVAPAGMEEGQSVALPDEELGLVVGEASTFRFFASSTRKDPVGELIDVRGDDPGELAPVEKAIEITAERKAGEVVPVRLESKVTEIGTLELWCNARDGKNRWKLEYSVRDTTE